MVSRYPSRGFKSSILFPATSSLYLGPNHSKYAFQGRFRSIVCSILRAHAVSYVQHLDTFLMVYPPPPRRMSGNPESLRYLTQFACPSIVKLKHPNLSPERESAPHCNTTAEGWNQSRIRWMTGSKTPLNASSVKPSRSGTFTA